MKRTSGRRGGIAAIATPGAAAPAARAGCRMVSRLRAALAVPAVPASPRAPARASTRFSGAAVRCAARPHRGGWTSDGAPA